MTDHPPITDITPASELFDLTERVAIVTGATAGLGARFARVLAQAGAHVVLAARRAERLERLAAELPNSLAVPTDMRHEPAITNLIERALDRFGSIDILVNNAGAVDREPALDLSADEFRDVLQLNLTAPFLLARLAARGMLERERGSIINIASVNGFLASRSWPETAYAASKGGIINLTRELANQWAAQGLRVNAIAPGYFPTEMTAELLETQQGSDWVTRHTPMRRPGAAHELDGTLLFLASDASSYITGQTIVVDGGWSVV
jgi:NAD(P)-dependent dehydrogenase (short-subunit alcohol dehydrogenase family)